MTNTLTATIDIDATPEQVWAIVSDLKRMGEWSPQCRKMRVSGPVGRGTKTFNINRKGFLVWPTTSKVVAFEPNSKLAFRINENRTVWTYQLVATDSGTTVTETREAPNGTSGISRFLVDKLMGGTADFEREMVEGMNTTLARIKSEAETH